jgi:thiol peroxidase
LFRNTTKTKIMNTTLFKGNPVRLAGNTPQKGQQAPDFSYVAADLSEQNFSAIQAKARVVIAVPSLDTGICAIETRTFNQRLANMPNVSALVISKDLPFAMKRFCETEGIANVSSASDFRTNFTKNYNLEIQEGPLKGLCARAVYVVNANNEIVHSELVDDIVHEPNYDKVLEAVNALV